MNCRSEKDVSVSQKQFENAKTYSEFLNLWSKFYENKICLPTYLSVFIGATDNPQANEAMGKKFQQIVKYGLIPYSFQTNLLGSQKGYFKAFSLRQLALVVTRYINRYPGFVAFWQIIEDNKNYPHNLYVTYNADDNILENSKKVGVFLGNPSTHIGRPGKSIFNKIRGWLSDPLRDIINNDNFVQIIVIDTEPNQLGDRILGVIINSLKDNY